MMKNAFFYEDGQDNVYYENGERVFDPMEGILTEITDPRIVLEALANQKTYLSVKPTDKEATIKKKKMWRKKLQ